MNRTHIALLIAFTITLHFGNRCTQAQPVAATATGLPPLADLMAEDAELADVHFVDERRGWAVGDRGVIWHTADGGRAWRRQSSGVTCPLTSVWFISPTHGWAVGGTTTAYTHATSGVVLHTTDGGGSWTPLQAPLLPALTRVKFFNAQRGMAAGAGSAFYPSGAFATSDGGRSWQTLASSRGGAWFAADFVDPDHGALAGAKGSLASVVDGEIQTLPPAESERRGLHALRFATPTGGWLVGDGGLVRSSRDLGVTWQPPAGAVSPEVAQVFDWRCVETVGSHVWIGGAPGSIVLHSPDGGAAWQLQPTGQTLPIRDIAFVDAQRGWAVGALGTILATQDGGNTWQLQRAGGRRAALWAALTRPARTPPELIAKHAVAEGYLTSVSYMLPPDNDARELPALEAARAREAVVGFGGSSADVAWQVPGTIEVAALSLEVRLVRDIRMWRPEVVLIEQPAAIGGDAGVALVRSAMDNAFAAAGDKTKYPELAALGLPAWQPKRLCAVEPEGRPGGLRINTGDFAATLGASLAQYVAPNVGLVNRDYATARAHYDLTVLQSAPLGSGLRRDLFDGLVVHRAGEARRAQAAPAVGELDSLRRLAQQRRHMQELLKRNSGNKAWAAQVMNLTGGLDPQSGGELLFQLAEGYRAAGQLDMAADTYYLLARRYNDHAVVPRALTWLVQYYASGELAHQAAARTAESMRGSKNLANVATKFRGEPSDRQQISKAPSAESTGLPLEPSPTGAILMADARFQRATLLAQYLDAARPALFAEPSLRFPLAAAQRNLGDIQQPDQFYAVMGKQAGATAWRECAEAERWLREPQRQPSAKRVATCRATTDRPHLDGLLDEPLWQTAELIKFASTAPGSAGGPVVNGTDERPSVVASTRSGDPRTAGAPTLTLPLEGRENPPAEPGADADTTIRIMRDEEFLYIAVTCAKHAGVNYITSDAPRPRDADLAQHDRVALRIDIDRDYTTACEFTVDHRGWMCDACWGDLHWDPSWFVAAQQTESEWTVEAAIPLDELVELPLPPTTVWALAIERTTPGVGTRTWNGEASAPASPARFGLLLFE